MILCIICTAGASALFVLLWGIVEMWGETGSSPRRTEDGLNAFQQPLGQIDYPERNLER